MSHPELDEEGELYLYDAELDPYSSQNVYARQMDIWLEKWLSGVNDTPPYNKDPHDYTSDCDDSEGHLYSDGEFEDEIIETEEYVAPQFDDAEYEEEVIAERPIKKVAHNKDD